MLNVSLLDLEGECNLESCTLSGFGPVLKPECESSSTTTAIENLTYLEQAEKDRVCSESQSDPPNKPTHIVEDLTNFGDESHTI